MAKIYIPAAGECEILDDIDFMSEARTIHFSLEGIYYEIDLSATNLQKLRDCLRPYITVSHIIRRDNLSSNVMMASRTETTAHPPGRFTLHGFGSAGEE